MRTRVGKLIGAGLGLAAAVSLVVSIPAAARPGSSASITKSAAPEATRSSQLAAATETINLCADDTASVTMPDSVVVPFWGFSLKNGGCAAPQLPGPPLEVSAGNDIVINLTNNLSQNLSLVFPGQIGVTASIVPPGTGASGDFGLEALPGETIRYEFAADQPGTYLYESSRNRQVMMGLYGALIVLPGTGAYGSGTEFDEEATLVLGEIDPAFNGSPSSFNLVNFAPEYWLINGKAYDDTDTIDAAPGSRLLLRYLNAGSFHHTMTMLGANQCVIAKDAYRIGIPYDVVAETIPAGSTLDAIVALPADAASGTTFPLYNRQLHLNNASSFPGGMLTFVSVNADPAPDPLPPPACVRGAPVNQAPFVNLGPHRTVTQTTASLDGIVTDDGLPSGALTTTWTKQSGPAVTFGDASLVKTTVTFSADGTYLLRLTAYDGALATYDEVSITADLKLHIGDLDGATGSAPGNRWRAIVTISVHDVSHSPISGAVVTGSWDTGNSQEQTTSCTTGTNGTCTVQSGRNTTSVMTRTFSVTSITKAAYTYASAANHDPDGDSTGTSITVAKP
jgi:FtsP/CotA-like multicopper oxidase with cupredoxin domain